MARIASLAVLLVVLLVPAAQAAGPAATVRALDRQMNQAGTGSGALVIDLDSGATLYARRPDVPRIPASVNKLYTTSAAMTLYGDEGTLTTELLGDTQPDDDGVVTGNLYLRGGGDPEFDRADARRLARILATSGLTEVTNRVLGDESKFDRLRGGPDSAYRVSEWVGPLSALPFHHGFTLARNPRFQRNPPQYAAKVFTRELKRAGVIVRRPARAGVAPDGAETLGEWESNRMAVIARHTNRPSDNYFAETLLKNLGADFGSSGTTAAGAVVARRQAARYGARPTMRVSLAVAGKSGTLFDRMRDTAAKGRCRAKTGTISGVSNLAGYCNSKSGARLAFAFLMSGISTWTGHRLQDRMATSLARYRP
jgi:D-alanyl-D-alanine carboxypeptidase/D-alanyl-D-alanine-endopeptidase (penicillin-binding protein 4)